MIIRILTFLLFSLPLQAKVSDELKKAAENLKTSVKTLKSIPPQLKTMYEQIVGRQPDLEKGIARINKTLDEKNGVIVKTRRFVESWGWKEDWVTNHLRDDLEDALTSLETALGNINDDLKNLLQNIDQTKAEQDPMTQKLQESVRKSTDALTKRTKEKPDLPTRLKNLGQTLKNFGF